MATAEPAPASLGPRYAPDDPTLPNPWKGLIDGSTGTLYYWNPETNITQYEKPSPLLPPLPPGLPSSASTPKLAPIPGAQMMQSNGVAGLPGQQMAQIPQQQGQQTNSSQQNPQLLPQVSQPHSSQLAQAGQQQGSPLGQAMQQQGHLMQQQLRQQPNQQGLLQSGQQMSQQSAQQMPQQSMQLLPGQHTPLYQGSQMGQSQGHQFAHQQTQYMAYQQTTLPQGQQSLQQKTQHIVQGHLFPHQQEQEMGFQHREDVVSQQGKQIGFSSPQIQQSGGPQTVPGGTNSIQMQQMSVQSGQAQQFGSSSLNMQQPGSLVPLLQSGIDLAHQQHGPRFQNQLDPAIMHSQQPSVAPVNLKMGFEENASRRAGNECYFNASNDGAAMVPQQPKLAAIPMARNQQEMRMGGAPLQNVMPGIAGGPNSIPGPSLHNIHGHATGGPAFPNNALMRSPPMILGSSDAISLSPAEVYRQRHEVTATGGDVPAPFMTFEATGFPPEILREVRYLLPRRSICRTLHCYLHSYVTTILTFGGCKMDEACLCIFQKGGSPFIQITLV